MDHVLTATGADHFAAPRRHAGKGIPAAVAVLCGVALALRIAAAQGDLGLDEIWSLKMAATLPDAGAAFWGLPHDNNHALNTAMMVLLGPHRAVWVYRSMSIVFGVLTVIAVAQVLARKGGAAMVTGATLAAVSLPFVDFGSEARGYAGLTLASVVAIGIWDRFVTAYPDWQASAAGRRARWWLAAAALFGALNHLAMLTSVGVLGAATLILAAVRTRRLRAVVALCTDLFAPTAAVLLLPATALAVAIWGAGTYRIGDVDPFSPGKLATGLGDMLTLTLGLPMTSLAPLSIVLAAIGLMVARRRNLVSAPTTALSVAALLVLPAALWAVHMPNVAYARYFAICAVVVVLAVAEVAGRLWTSGGHARRWVAAGVAAIAIANLLADVPAILDGRSAATRTLALMQAEGDGSYTADRLFMAQLMLGAARGVAAPPTPPDAVCAAPPDWYIAVGTYDGFKDGSVTTGTGGCEHVFRARAIFTSNPLSGLQWTLYRRRS